MKFYMCLFVLILSAVISSAEVGATQKGDNPRWNDDADFIEGAYTGVMVPITVLMNNNDNLPKELKEQFPNKEVTFNQNFLIGSTKVDLLNELHPSIGAFLGRHSLSPIKKLFNIDQDQPTIVNGTSYSLDVKNLSISGRDNFSYKNGAAAKDMRFETMSASELGILPINGASASNKLSIIVSFYPTDQLQGQ